MVKRLKYLLMVVIVGRILLRINRIIEERRLRKRQSQKKDSVYGPPIISSSHMKEIMSYHYLKGAYPYKKVAWVTSGAPIESLLALDYHLFYPENHAAICGARRLSGTLIEDSEDFSYSQDLCSYVKVNLGSILKGKDPVARIPAPDLILSCNNICQTVLYWYRVIADIYKIPIIVIDTPFVYDNIKPHYVEYVKSQLNSAVEIMEGVAKKQLREDRLRKIVLLSKEAVNLWLKVLLTAAYHPSPITAFDTFIHMGPIVNLRGKKSTVDYYKRLLQEIEWRIKNKIGAIHNEEYRLLWDNLPIWFMLKEISSTLVKYNASIIAATFSYAWGEIAPLMDESRPLDSISKAYLQVLLNRSTRSKLNTMKKLISDLKIDGVILHSNRSCKPYSLGQIDQRNRIISEIGIPAFLIEADQADSRDFNINQARLRLQAFIEQIKERRCKG